MISLRQEGVIIDVIAPDRPAIRDNLFDILQYNPNLEPTLEPELDPEEES